MHMSLFHSRCPVDSIRDAVFTVSPNKQYLGIFIPTTPAAQGPGHTHVNIQSLSISAYIRLQVNKEWLERLKTGL